MVDAWGLKSSLWNWCTQQNLQNTGDLGVHQIPALLMHNVHNLTYFELWSIKGRSKWYKKHIKVLALDSILDPGSSLGSSISLRAYFHRIPLGPSWLLDLSKVCCLVSLKTPVWKAPTMHLMQNAIRGTRTRK